MPKITLSIKTAVTPQQFIAALTDFGPDRSELWPNSQANYFEVHDVGSDSAEVTEGSAVFGGVWERLRYDWSQQNRITLTTLDSNYWKAGGGWTYAFAADPHSDRSNLTLTIRRQPKTAKALLAIVLVGVIGRVVIKRQLQRTLHAIETKQQV